jgi:hypothetical protein
MITVKPEDSEKIWIQSLPEVKLCYPAMTGRLATNLKFNNSPRKTPNLATGHNWKKVHLKSCFLNLTLDIVFSILQVDSPRIFLSVSVKYISLSKYKYIPY